MQDRVVRVVLFHGVQIGGAFEEVDALAGGVFGADGLAVDALGGEALGGQVRVSGGILGTEGAMGKRRWVGWNGNDGPCVLDGRWGWYGGYSIILAFIPCRSPLRETRQRRHVHQRHQFSPSFSFVFVFVRWCMKQWAGQELGMQSFVKVMRLV